MRDSEEADILNKVVADYNRAGLPGQYKVVDSGDGSFAVVGTAIEAKDGTAKFITPILDTPISIPEDSNVDAVAVAVSAASGTRVGTNGLMAGDPAVKGGNNIPARTILKSMPFLWDLYYEYDMKTYMLNLSVGHLAHYDNQGIQTVY